MNRPSLYLHQELLLMALHDEKGTLDWKAGHYVYAVGGALHLLVVDQFALDLYYGAGWSPFGFSHNMMLALRSVY